MTRSDPLTIHIDPCGGIAGDMMIAAMVDTFPEARPELEEMFRASPLKDVATLEIREDHDRHIRGLYVDVRAARHEHVHRSFSDIREILKHFPPAVRERAADIFHRIAVAEAFVHGTTIEAVHFHEVGAWDSIADIVGVSLLIEASGANEWSCGVLPLGSGTVNSAHGVLPVPAPATVEILRGCEIELGGPPCERVTPTGAAIIAHLAPTFRTAVKGRLVRSGSGLGRKRDMPFINAVRLFALETSQSIGLDEKVGVIACEIDDQSPEDLAIAIEHLRAATGVLDVIQNQVIGKKGRMAIQLQVLTAPSALESVIAACFHETTSLGLRYSIQSRRILRRRAVDVGSGGVSYRAKTADRAAGETTKIEADDLAAVNGHGARQAIRARHEHSHGHDHDHGHRHDHGHGHHHEHDHDHKL
jgi:uncharacterized protein (TIGR00299 family) protein